MNLNQEGEMKMKEKIFQRIWVLMLAVALVFSGITPFNSISVNAAVEPAKNLITNGDFTNGFDSWNVYFYNSNCASAKVTSNYEFDMTVNYWDQWSWDGNTYYKISWQSLIEQNVTLQSGKQYTIRFDGYASENRTIQMGIKSNDAYKFLFDLTTENTTYSKTFTVSSDVNQLFQILFGYIEENGAINPEGKHDVFISNIYLVEGDGSNIVETPIITGIEEGAEYISAVEPGVKFSKPYSISLYYKESADVEYSLVTDYELGSPIKDDGFYKLVVSDKDDSNNSTQKEFSINKGKIDYTKEYYIIKSRSNGMVLTAKGYLPNSPVIQTRYNQEVEQFFSMESSSNGKIIFRSLSNGNVLAVENMSASDGAGIVLSSDATNSFSQWSKLYIAQGYNSLINAGSGKALDVPGANGSSGIQLDQYTSNKTNAQQWDIIKIDISNLTDETKTPDVSTEGTWKVNSIISPVQDKLTAAGPIYLKWYNAKALGTVSKYEIKFDDETTVTVAQKDDEVLEYEWYNTSVSSHTVTVTAVMNDGTKVAADEVLFYVTKKGIGWGSLYRTQDMNLSWYYQWSMEESAGTSEDLQFVPMVWGNWGSEWLNNKDNQKYKTVLGFNEPDFNEQSALTVNEALSAWRDFSNSGLRTGSPCTAIGAYWSKDWFWKFMDGVEADNDLSVDFITIHCYMDNASVKSFLELIDNTWEKWHKPIWITEFGVAKWGTGNAIWNSNTKNANYTVYQFMKKVLPELDKRPYVERYAWFPFDPKDAYGGASGIFDYDNGELNELGKLYANSGMPEGYDYVKYKMNPPTGEEISFEEESETTTNATTKPTTKPVTIKRAVINKLTSKKKKVVITLKKQTGISGYEIRWSKKKNFKNSKKIITKNRTKFTINKFKKDKNKTKYYFKVRAFKKVKGVKKYGKYSSIKTVRIKK